MACLLYTSRAARETCFTDCSTRCANSRSANGLSLIHILILDNLSRLIKDKIDVTVRIPVIPGYNDTPQSAVKSAQYIKAYGPAPVNLIPFHRLGSQKYAAMGTNYAYSQIPPLAPDRLEQLLKIYTNAGLEAEIMK